MVALRIVVGCYVAEFVTAELLAANEFSAIGICKRTGNRHKVTHCIIDNKMYAIEPFLDYNCRHKILFFNINIPAMLPSLAANSFLYWCQGLLSVADIRLL